MNKLKEYMISSAQGIHEVGVRIVVKKMCNARCTIQHWTMQKMCGIEDSIFCPIAVLVACINTVN